MSVIGFAVRKLYYGKETTYGTAASPDSVFGIPIDWDSGAEPVEEVIYAGDRSPFTIQRLGYDVNPSASFYLVDGRFLPLLLGSVQNTGTAAPYTHTVTVGPTLPSATIVAVRGSAAERVTGALVSEWEISSEADGFVEVSLSFAGKAMSILSPYSDPNIALPTARPFRHSDAVVTWGTTTLGRVTSISISGSNSLEPLPRGSDGTVGGYAILTAEYEAEIEVVWEDYTLATDFLNATRRNLSVKYVRTAGNDEIEFQLSECLLTWASEISYEGDVMTQTIGLKPKSITIVGKDSYSAW